MITSRRRRRQAPALCVATLGALALLPSPAALADSRYVTFDVRTVGAIYDFDVLVPDVLPLKVTGGILASSAQAAQSPKAFGTAGLAPVPALTSVGILIPQNVPVVGSPVPQQIQDGLASIDYTKLPGYCQAAYPTSSTTTTEARCGGPTQPDSGLGFSFAGGSGRISATGDANDEDSARTVSTSSGASAGISAAMVNIANYEASAAAGLNTDGVPESHSTATIQGVSLLGGAVSLKGLHSETRLAYDGTKSGLAGSTSFDVENASILGVPVTIGPNGFAVAGSILVPRETTASLIQQLNSLLDVQGFTMRLFPPSPVSRSGSQVTMSSGGLEVSYVIDSPKEVRYHGRFGFTQANVVAVPGFPSSGSGDGSSTDTGSSGSVSDSPNAGVGGSFTSGDLQSGEVSLDGGVAGLPPTYSLPPTASSSGGFAQRTGDQSLLRGIPVAAVAFEHGRLEDLYLAFALLMTMTVAATKVRRLSMPAVLPFLAARTR